MQKKPSAVGGKGPPGLIRLVNPTVNRSGIPGDLIAELGTFTPRMNAQNSHNEKKGAALASDPLLLRSS